MFQLASYMYSMMLTNEEITCFDWSRGLSGTGEFSYDNSIFNTAYQVGSLAESWEFTDPNTITLHVRKGVRYGLNPQSEASRLVNGREFVAEDMAFSISRAWKMPLSWLGQNYPGWLKSATATDKYTVVVKGDDNLFRTALVWERLSDYLYMVPPEIVNKYKDMSDWKNSVGTGPYFLTDYVADSSFTFTRNPTHWRTDPAGPGKGNQIPYIDTVKYLVMKDISTRTAAMRVGKVDALNGYGEIGVENSEALMKEKPAILWKRILLGSGSVIMMRSDLKPFNDIRVRQALFLAIDNPSIVKDYFGGNAEILPFPVTPLPEFKDAYTPLDQLPAATRELYEYHPDKAKQLLAEAGYPNGFKTDMPVDSGVDEEVDLSQVYKAMWAKVGIDVELKLMPTTAYNSIAVSHSYTGLIFGSRGFNTPYQASEYVPGHVYNRSIIDDPYLNERIPQLYSFENIGTGKPAAILKEMTQYALSKAWFQGVPLSYAYHLWWPWLKNHHGEYTTGFHGKWDWVKYAWIDQDLKKSMGY